MRADPDIDLDAAEWEVVGKNEKVDIFLLAPPLIRAFRVYRRWQLSEAERRPAMRDALADPEQAYVLMTTKGRKTSASTVTKIATWHGIRAWVEPKRATPGIDAVNGMTSRVTPQLLQAGLGDDRPERLARWRHRPTGPGPGGPALVAPPRRPRRPLPTRRAGHRMNGVRKAPEAVWEFVVGDDWRLAAAAAAAIGGAAILVEVGVNAWWWVPALVALTLWLTVTR